MGLNRFAEYMHSTTYLRFLLFAFSFVIRVMQFLHQQLPEGFVLGVAVCYPRCTLWFAMRSYKMIVSCLLLAPAKPMTIADGSCVFIRHRAHYIEKEDTTNSLFLKLRTILK